MSGVNKVAILGRLGQDPELKYTPSGVPVVSFSVATSESWKDKDSGEKKEKTEWHRIVAWNKTAENVAKYLKKGSQCYVDGKLQTRSWDDKNGEKRYATEIVATEVHFIGSSDNSGGAARPPHPAEGATATPPANMPKRDDFAPDELPF